MFLQLRVETILRPWWEKVLGASWRRSWTSALDGAAAGAWWDGEGGVGLGLERLGWMVDGEQQGERVSGEQPAEQRARGQAQPQGGCLPWVSLCSLSPFYYVASSLERCY